MANTKRVFSLDKFLETLEQEKADGIIRQQDIDFALISWANALAGKTAEEIDAAQGESGSSTLKPEWFVDIIEEADV